MKTTRPQFLSSMPGNSARVRRTPLMTFSSNMSIQSRSVISPNFFTSKVPTLLTRMSTGPMRATPASRVFAPSAVMRSAAMPCASPRFDMADTACFTDCSERPLRITRAPSDASASAVARPMPIVEPVISASLPLIPRSMSSARLVVLELLAQPRLQHLAGRALGNFAHESVGVRQAEFCELRREVPVELVLRGALSRLQHDDRQRPLAPLRVGHRNHRGLRDLGVPHQRVLEVERADPLAARLHEVLDAVGNLDVSTRINRDDVAG